MDFTSLQVHVHQLDSTKSTWLHVILGPTWRLTILFPSQTRLCFSHGSRLSSQQFPHFSLGSRRHLSPFGPTILILIFSPPILTTHSNFPFFPNKPTGFQRFPTLTLLRLRPYLRRVFPHLTPFKPFVLFNSTQ